MSNIYPNSCMQILGESKSVHTDQAIEIAQSLAAMVSETGGDIDMDDPHEIAQLAQMSLNTCIHLLTYIETVQLAAARLRGDEG